MGAMRGESTTGDVSERGYSGYEEASDNVEANAKVSYWLAPGRK